MTEFHSEKIMFHAQLIEVLTEIREELSRIRREGPQVEPKASESAPATPFDSLPVDQEQGCSICGYINGEHHKDCLYLTI